MHWKFYFVTNVFLILFSIWSYVFLSTNNTSLPYDPIGYLFLFFSVIGLIGLYAYIFNKNILTPIFWKVFLVVELFVIAYGIINSLLTSSKDLTPYNLGPLQIILVSVGLSIVAILWDLPKIYALYKIGFTKSKL